MRSKRLGHDCVFLNHSYHFSFFDFPSKYVRSMLDFLEVKRFIGELMVLISVVSFFVKVKSSNNENLYPKNLKPLIKYNCAE